MLRLWVVDFTALLFVHNFPPLAPRDLNLPFFDPRLLNDAKDFPSLVAMPFKRLCVTIFAGATPV